MSYVVIEEKKLDHNIDIIKDKVKNIVDDKGNPLKIIAVLKGNAYGLGLEQMAKKLIDKNISFFAVTEVEEALKLREKGFSNEILVLNSTCIKQEVEAIVKNDLTATVGSKDAINMLNEVAESEKKIINCHLKIDTGFSRFGFRAEDIISEKENIKNLLDGKNNIKITGTYSHFQEAYASDNKITKKQFDLFLNSVAKIKSQGIDTGILHICNSSAFFKYRDMYLNAVRIGSAFTGRLQIKETTGLQRVGYLETKVCEIKDLKKNDKVGYSGTCKLKRDTKVAIVEAGYFDGVGVTGPKDSVRLIDKLRSIKMSLSSLTKNGTKYVEIDNKKFPIIGRIGMKNLMIDVTESDVRVNDCVKIDINIVLANQNLERRYIK